MNQSNFNILSAFEKTNIVKKNAVKKKNSYFKHNAFVVEKTYKFTNFISWT